MPRDPGRNRSGRFQIRERRCELKKRTTVGSGKRKQTAPATPRFNPHTLLTQIGDGRTVLNYKEGQAIFAQGDPADAIFYIQKRGVKLTAVPKPGREAVLALLGPGDFFGESSLTAQPLFMKGAVAINQSTIIRVEKQAMIRLLRQEPALSELFMTHLLSRNIRIEEDLVDLLFNSSEKRLARILLLLANFGKRANPSL